MEVSDSLDMAGKKIVNVRSDMDQDAQIAIFEKVKFDYLVKNRLK